MIISHRGS
jgi:hypothetical protein